jgi:hypothetical protein
MLFSIVLSGCTDTQERLVTIEYRESMQFRSFTDNNQTTFFSGNQGTIAASFCQITCFNNGSSNPSDFTFDISKVIPHPTAGPGTIVTRSIAAGSHSVPAGWTHPSLTASTQLVPKGFVGPPPVSPYSFVVIWDNGNAGQHHLLYQATGGQPVVMHQDAVQPVFREVVLAADLSRGEWVNLPPLPPPSCP